MKFKLKKRVQKDGRFRWEGFLFLPLCCNGEWRWLEYAKWSSNLPYPAQYDRRWDV